MRAWWLVLVAACGGGDPETASFEVVGHSDLGARGMNAAIAVVGSTVYVGSRIDSAGIAIVDVADPERPAVVGEIDRPFARLPGMSSRELRVVPELDLLIVLNLQCSPELHGCAGGGEEQNLRLFDIRDRRAPQLVATYRISTTLAGRSPHELYVWRDASRTLVFLAAPDGPPALEVIDVSNPRMPVRVAAWDPGVDDILHSVGVSADGTVAYLSHQLSGLLLADISQLPAISLITPPSAALRWEQPIVMGPHSAVPLPGRDVLVVTEEIYPMPFGGGCPWGHLRTVDISDPAAPTLLGEFRLPENDPSYCAGPTERVAFTAHNVTATRDLALVTWYAGGLQALDLSDPTQPVQLAEFRPEPLGAVTVEDPGLGGHGVEMWSYPVIQNGLIYVVDVRNGLYVLRYRGPFAGQVTGETFLEGNSNL